MAITVLWNLTDIYFNIQCTGKVTAGVVVKMTDLYIKRIELSSKLKDALNDEQAKISQEFTSVSDERITLLGKVLARVESDISVVKTELIRVAFLLENTDRNTSFFDRI